MSSATAAGVGAGVEVLVAVGGGAAAGVATSSGVCVGVGTGAGVSTGAVVAVGCGSAAALNVVDGADTALGSTGTGVSATGAACSPPHAAKAITADRHSSSTAEAIPVPVGMPQVNFMAPFSAPGTAESIESPLVITVRKPYRKPKAGAPRSRKASSPARTVNIDKQKQAKTTGNGKPAAQVTAIKPKGKRKKDGLTTSKPTTSEAPKKLRRGEVPKTK